MLRTENLIKRYGGRNVVDAVSLEIERGQIVGLLGPNGAGKTTTFYLMIGLIAPEQGHIYLNGERIDHLAFYARARRGLSYLPQEPSVFRKLSVQENLLAVLQNLEASAEKREQRAHELLEKLGIAHLAERRAHTLSAGERRRVEITRALVMQPSFMLLDEPFSGIDPISVQEIQKMILALKQENIGLIVTDHNVRETLKVTDYAYLMNEGKILLKGTPNEIAQDPLAKRFYLGEGFQLS